MLTLHQLFIKTGLIFLILGTLLGSLMQIGEALGKSLPANAMTVHIHLMAIGFALMMIMGVAYWMFPRPSGATPREAARDPLAWTSYFLLVPGLLLRALGYLVLSPARPVLVLSAALQAAGVFCFVFAIWKRVGMPRAYYREKAELEKKGSQT